jgi:hypothetical protein
VYSLGRVCQSENDDVWGVAESCWVAEACSTSEPPADSPKLQGGLDMSGLT